MYNGQHDVSVDALELRADLHFGLIADLVAHHVLPLVVAVHLRVLGAKLHPCWEDGRRAECRERDLQRLLHLLQLVVRRRRSVRVEGDEECGLLSAPRHRCVYVVMQPHSAVDPDGGEALHMSSRVLPLLLRFWICPLNARICAP